MALGAELGDRGVEVAGGPQCRCVEHQAQTSELVFLAVSVGLLYLAAFAVADHPGQAVAGLLDGELAVHPAPIGVIDWVNEAEQVHRLVDAPVLGERLPERGGVPARPNIRSRS